MNEKFLVLERSIRADLEAIERLYGDLGEPQLGESEAPETLIVIAYRLHSLYSAFENLFKNIAESFENHLDPSAWHRDLLKRMRLDLTPVRPAVIDEEAYEKLDELLRFRHVFRASYSMKLDPLRLQLVLRSAGAETPLLASDPALFRIPRLCRIVQRSHPSPERDDPFLDRNVPSRRGNRSSLEGDHPSIGRNGSSI